MLIYPQSDYVYVDVYKKDRTFRGLAPPLGLLYLARIFEQDGDNVQVVDFSAESFNPEKIVDAVKKADIVGLTVLSYSISFVKEIIDVIKKVKPDVKVLIGGPHCAMFPEKAVLETGADICVHGDGEKTLLKIASTFLV